MNAAEQPHGAAAPAAGHLELEREQHGLAGAEKDRVDEDHMDEDVAPLAFEDFALDKMVPSSSSAPEDNNLYVVYTCTEGHTTPVYVYSREEAEKGVHPPLKCAAPCRHVAERKLNIVIGEIDRPVAVWFTGRGKMPWMSMLRACNADFVDQEIVGPKGAHVTFLKCGDKCVSQLALEVVVPLE